MNLLDLIKLKFGWKKAEKVAEMHSSRPATGEVKIGHGPQSARGGRDGKGGSGGGGGGGGGMGAGSIVPVFVVDIPAIIKRVKEGKV